MNRIEGPAFACSFGEASENDDEDEVEDQDEDQGEEDIGGSRGEDCQLFD